MSTTRKATALMASPGMTLDTQVPWLWNLRSFCGPRGIESVDIIEAQAVNPVDSVPVSIRVPVDPARVTEVLGTSIALIARISIISAELALNVHDNVSEMILVKSPAQVVVLNDFVETTFKFYSATV